MIPLDNSHLSQDDLLREAHAGVKVLLERTADYSEIRKKVAQHDVTIKWMRRVGLTALASVFTAITAYIKSHLPR